MATTYLSEGDPEWQTVKSAWDDFADLRPADLQVLLDRMRRTEAELAEESKTGWRRGKTQDDLVKISAARVRYRWRITVAERLLSIMESRTTKIPRWDDIVDAEANQVGTDVLTALNKIAVSIPTDVLNAKLESALKELERNAWIQQRVAARIAEGTKKTAAMRAVAEQDLPKISAENGWAPVGFEMIRTIMNEMGE